MSVEQVMQIWPDWSVGKRIGGGAYGTVYEASRNEYGVENRAAIKVITIPANEAEVDTLRAEGYDEQGVIDYFKTVVKDFVNEICLMVSLEGSSNIVHVKDYKVVEKAGAFGWEIFILMELLTPFADYTREHKLPEAEVIRLGCDICAALEVCAKENIIHRDIKPGNILVHKSGTFKLGDFGVARKLENMTGGLSRRYTPKYMAPEVATSNIYDKRVDIYSLGIMLYELLNQRCIPFLEDRLNCCPADIEEAVNRRISGERLPPPREASAAMAQVILRACAYDPKDRFASAEEMRKALMEVLGNASVSAEEDIFDKTVEEDIFDKTVSVRRAPVSNAAVTPPSGVQKGAQTHQQSVETFGNVPKDKRRQGLLAVVLAVAILFAAATCVLGVMLRDKDQEDTTETTEETANYSSFDEERINTILSDAEALAAQGDYQGALTTVKTGLITYPKSTELQEKEIEYTDKLNEQIGAATEAVIPQTEPAAISPVLPVTNVTKAAITGASASSYYSEPTFNIWHKPERVLDGKMDTAWVEGSSSQGVGENLTIHLKGEYLVSGLTIYAGYHKTEELYYKNSRPQEIRISFSDGTYHRSVLYDVMQGQMITFDKPIKTSTVTVEIVSVYAGSTYKDTVITEISLF